MADINADTGLSKQAGYNPRCGAKTLLTGEISKASAQQRADLAGRTRKGTCFRLYTKKDFETSFIPRTIPGILEDEMTGGLLLLKSMGFNVAKFDFIDAPGGEVYLRGVQELLDV